MREILIQNAQLVNEGEVSQKDLLIRGEMIVRVANHIKPGGGKNSLMHRVFIYYQAGLTTKYILGSRA